MSLNIIGHCTNILEEMWFSSPPETSAEPYIYISGGNGIINIVLNDSSDFRTPSSCFCLFCFIVFFGFKLQPLLVLRNRCPKAGPRTQFIGF